MPRFGDLNGENISVFMSKFDFLKSLQVFVERKAKSFLEKNGCVDSFTEIKKKAETANLNDGINNYFNVLTNDSIDVVVKNTQKPAEIVYEEFCEHYFGIND